jgi:hypothetical protein
MEAGHHGEKATPKNALMSRLCEVEGSTRLMSRGPLVKLARLDKLAIFGIRRKRDAFHTFLFSLLKIPSYERCVFRNITAATISQLTSCKRDLFDQMRIHTKLKTSFS